MKEVYAIKNNEKEILKSSSGGAFIAICDSFEKLYGTGNVSYYGVIFDEEMNVIHKRVQTADECHIFQGSKYVKSEYSLVLKEIEEDIKENKKILFSGTPCQVVGIKKYLESKEINYEDIFYIDIICHGTPKVEFWNDYKKWLENRMNSKLVNYSFRYKQEGWKAYPAYAKFQNNKELINTAETSIYSKLHMLGYITCKGCFSCPFSNKERNGDITLGDYWGIENILPKFPSKKGVSLVILNNVKMKNIINDIQNNEELVVEKTETEEYLKYQHNLNKSTEKPKKYEEFWNDYKNSGFEFVLKKYLNYGLKYKIKFEIKKIIRKTPLINQYRKLKNMGKSK